MKFNVKKFRFENEFKQSDLTRWAKQGLVSSNVQTDVMDVVSIDYPKIVREIHHEFLTAGDKLLKTAEDLLDTLSVPNQEKIAKLKDLGFNQSKQVVETAETIKKIDQQNKIADAVSYFRMTYPNYKFITKEIAEKICEKYNLVIGAVGKFKGFVPEKNLVDIAKFFETHPDDEFVYYEIHNQTGGYTPSYANTNSMQDAYLYQAALMAAQVRRMPFTHTITKKQFEDTLEKKKQGIDIPINEPFGKGKSNWYQGSYKAQLTICAPIKDMDMTNMTLKGRTMVVHVPDPVVMLEKSYGGIKGYIIATAWGDEASDPLVVNEQMN